MKTFDAVKKGFKTTNSLKKVVFLFVLLNVALTAVNILPGIARGTAAEPDLITALFTLLTFFVVSGFTIFFEGGTLGIIKEQHERHPSEQGAFFGYGRFLGYAKKFFLPLLLTLLLYGFLLGGALISLLLFFFLSGLLPVPFLPVLVGILLLAGAGVLGILIVYPQFIVVAEEGDVIAAFARSIRFAKNNFKGTLLLLLMYWFALTVSLVTVGVVLLVATFAVGALFRFAVSPAWVMGPFVVMFGLILVSVYSYFEVLYLSLFMNFYLDRTAASSGVEAVEVSLPAGDMTAGPFDE